jgi:hypothetical protein
MHFASEMALKANWAWNVKTEGIPGISPFTFRGL